jgi:hypothetical protein
MNKFFPHEHHRGWPQTVGAIFASICTVTLVMAQGFAQNPASNPYSPQGVVKAILFTLKARQDVFQQNRDACIRDIQQSSFPSPHECGGGYPTDPRTGLLSMDPSLDAFRDVYDCQIALGRGLGIYQLAQTVDNACRGGQQRASTKTNYNEGKPCWPQLLQANDDVDVAYRNLQARNTPAANQAAAQGAVAFKQAMDCLKRVYINEITLSTWMATEIATLPLAYTVWFKSLSAQQQGEFVSEATKEGVPQQIISGITGGSLGAQSTTPPRVATGVPALSCAS